MPFRIQTHRPAQLKYQTKRDDSARPNAYQRGYTDKAHRAWRQAVLTRDAWCCVACGTIANSNHADHIKPVAEGGKRYDVENGQTLCVKCHGKKTRSEQNRIAKTKKQP